MSGAVRAFATSLIAVALLANASDKQGLARFEKQAEELRALLKIPGLSAVIVKDQKALWAKGFGFADLENRAGSSPSTAEPS
jgi:CubicO group peptidase (beta-lactamase class C family)